MKKLLLGLILSLTSTALLAVPTSAEIQSACVNGIWTNPTRDAEIMYLQSFPVSENMIKIYGAYLFHYPLAGANGYHEPMWIFINPVDVDVFENNSFELELLVLPVDQWAGHDMSDNHVVGEYTLAGLATFKLVADDIALVDYYYELPGLDFSPTPLLIEVDDWVLVNGNSSDACTLVDK